MSRPDLLGRGWAFPVLPDFSRHDLAYLSGPAKVRVAIGLILETEPGERVMRPDFGCGLRQFVMQANTVATRTLMQREVFAALDRWEPRIRLREVSVEQGPDAAEVIITIRYEHRADGRADLLVFPFDLGGG